MSSPVLELDDVSFSYADGTTVFEDVDLTVNEGDFVVLVAPNGGGKSTLLKLLCGLLEPTEGDIRYRGRPLDSYTEEDLYGNLGFVFQNPDDQLFGATVREDVAFGPRNLGLGPEEVNRRVEESLGAVDLEVDLDKAIHRLSFGQRKRVSLAGILAMGVDTLLLDEPTGELDPLGQQRIFELLKQLNQKRNKTVILATHHIDLLGAPFETITVLADSNRIVQGSPREIFADRDLLQQASLRPPLALTVCEKLRDHGEIDFGSPDDPDTGLWSFLEEHVW